MRPNARRPSLIGRASGHQIPYRPPGLSHDGPDTVTGIPCQSDKVAVHPARSLPEGSHLVVAARDHLSPVDGKIDVIGLRRAYLLSGEVGHYDLLRTLKYRTQIPYVKTKEIPPGILLYLQAAWGD